MRTPPPAGPGTPTTGPHDDQRPPSTAGDDVRLRAKQATPPRRPSRTTGRSAPLGERLDRPWPTQQPTPGQRARRRRVEPGTIAWLDVYGRWKSAELTRCAALEVWAFPPTREPHLHRRRGAVCGWVAFGPSAVMTVYESASERDVLLELEFDRKVLAVAAQPFVVQLADASTHRPDFAVSLSDERVLIVEVKHNGDACAAHEAEPHTSALRDALGALGWTYVTRAPAPVERRRNLRWLRGCRPQSRELEQLTAGMVATARDGCAIAELVALEHAAISRPVVGRLLWEHRLVCDLDSAISDQTVVRATPVGDGSACRDHARPSQCGGAGQEPGR